MTGMRSNIRLNWQYFWRRNRKAAVLLLVAAALLIPRRRQGNMVVFSRSSGGAGRAGGGVWRTGDHQWVPEDSPGRPGTLRTVKYIVIHETGNIAPGANAQRHSAYLLTGGGRRDLLALYRGRPRDLSSHSG